MNRDSAVSPVIGSILLVAITVIIAAVIAAFVFGMTGDIQQTRVVAITSDVAQNTPVKTIVLTNHGGKDAGALKDLTVVIDSTPYTFGALANTVCGNITSVALATTVGSSVKCQTSGTTREHLVVTGTFADGGKQVLLDTYQ
jgi:flagellin-like protein